jgi:solute carrier family 8 (sodium/calcium exchanger)
VEFADLKRRIQGEHMIGRLQYRKQVANVLKSKKLTVKKGEIFRQES